MQSNQNCPAGRPRTFTAEVQCNIYITGQGNGKIMGNPSMDADACDLVVIMQHESGCP